MRIYTLLSFFLLLSTSSSVYKSIADSTPTAFQTSNAETTPQKTSPSDPTSLLAALNTNPNLKIGGVN